MADTEERFITGKREGNVVKEISKTIITDTKTGVQYLYAIWGSGAGLTVLVDRDGKPLVDESYIQTN